GLVRPLRQSLEIMDAVHDRAGAAVLAPLVEGADLLSAGIGCGRPNEETVWRIVFWRVPAPVSIDVVPVVDGQGIELVCQRKTFIRDIHFNSSFGADVSTADKPASSTRRSATRGPRCRAPRSLVFIPRNCWRSFWISGSRERTW